jgi:hypothetical protein
LNGKSKRADLCEWKHSRPISNRAIVKTAAAASVFGVTVIAIYKTRRYKVIPIDGDDQKRGIELHEWRRHKTYTQMHTRTQKSVITS